MLPYADIFATITPPPLSYHATYCRIRHFRAAGYDARARADSASYFAAAAHMRATARRLLLRL